MASTKATVTTFAQAEEFLAGGRNKNSRNIANNTYVERRTEDRIAIRLHATDVVEYTRSGLLTLNTGGWRTVTTKDRIDSFIPRPLRVFSVKGQWRVATKNATKRWPEADILSPGAEYVTTDWDHGVIPFAEGITFRSLNGSWEPIAGTFPDESEQEKIAAARKSLDKSIKAYLKKADEVFPQWTEALKENGSLNPAGDPWCCTMGVGGSDNDHLWTHLREQYVFLTIFRKALEDSGKFRDPVQRLLMDIQLGWYDALKRELRKYLLKHLDPAVTVRTAQEKATQWLDYAEEALTKPSDFLYLGTDQSLWVTRAPTWGRNRDSEPIENANFEIVWESLCEQFPDLAPAEGVDRNTENLDGLYVYGASHWACGWVEQIVVPVLRRPGTVTADNLHPAFLAVCEAVEAVRLYPALPGAEERAAKEEVEV